MRKNDLAKLALGLIVFCFLLGTGCGATHRRDSFWHSQFGPKSTNGYEAYVISKLPHWRECYYQPKVSGCDPNTSRESYRNRVINGCILLADTAYSGFEQGYNAQIAYFQIGSDLVNLGLTAASAVTAPAALLGAAATGTQGVQHSVEKNGLDSQTRFVIISRMEAIRERQRQLIMKRELEPASCKGRTPSPGQIISDVCYSLEDAMVDVQQYFELGTVTRALTNIENQTQQIAGAHGPSAPPTITSSNNCIFHVRKQNQFKFTATGSPTPAITYVGTLPSDLKFTPNADGTATLAGTPAAKDAGKYQITIVVYNSVQAVQQKFYLTVQ